MAIPGRSIPLLFTALALLLLGCSVERLPPRDLPPISSLDRSSVQYLETDAGAVCAAVAIAPDRVLTAAHCLEDAEIVLTSPAGGQVSVGTILAVDEGVDLGLVQPGLAVDHWAEIGPEAGPSQVIYQVGHPLGMPYQVNYGYVLGACYLHDYGAGEVCLAVAAISTRPGNSGGGWFDYEGRLVGIVSLGNSTFGYGSAVPVPAIRAFLKAHEDAPEAASP